MRRRSFLKQSAVLGISTALTKVSGALETEHPAATSEPPNNLTTIRDLQEFERLGEDPRYATIKLGWEGWNFDTYGHTFVDSMFEGGASHEAVAFEGADGSRQGFTVMWTLHLLADPGAQATISDRLGRTVVRQRLADGTLDVALEEVRSHPREKEWRIHFHIPLHSEPTALFGNTSDHLLGVLDLLQAQPNICSHLEMETYTWEVMPDDMRSEDVTQQLTREYEWTLAALRSRQLA